VNTAQKETCFEKRRSVVTRIEQRGAVAFTGATVAAAVILLIMLWGYMF
jgi:hypothetical protein